MDEAEGTTSTSPDKPKQYEMVIHVQSPQSVSVTMRLWRWAGDFVAGVVGLVHLPPWDRHKYDHDQIRAVAQALIRDRGLDNSLNGLIERTRNECKRLGIKFPRSKRWRQKILKPVYDAAAQKAKK
jgi:hypothetical protein